MKILYINANPRNKKSVSEEIADVFVEQLSSLEKNAQVEYVHLYETELQEIDEDVLASWGKKRSGEPLTEAEAHKTAVMDRVLDQFLSADVYVFITPFWNLLFPPRLKTYIDSLCIPGKTFRYTAGGQEGLVEGKRAVHIEAVGGVYKGTGLNFSEDYLREIMRFLGIKEYDSVICEGMSQYPDMADNILKESKEEASQLAHKLARLE
ncbi:FMN-dependent NADH-azoreductase [Jeotgalibacillus sp. S-D1]|uniref:FMN-dependent NADH-azoreductase n=1 Tax=Jeotgalibacillus sp. S-D1 TaxID=2552189 RepID=UPI001059C456|nr:NAD(P)H-dependent oxidoreductase [Jeotgalibacillus sp. S-D1]TDL31530.1 FMN-dependent NADH-azoreductase [Jeotgalibacillus sp. S-D1]